MSTPEKKRHWNILAELLGTPADSLPEAEEQPVAPPPPAPSKSEPPKPAARSSKPPAPRKADWRSLAGILGLGSREEPPAEPEAETPDSSTPLPRADSPFSDFDEPSSRSPSEPEQLAASHWDSPSPSEYETVDPLEMTSAPFVDEVIDPVDIDDVADLHEELDGPQQADAPTEEPRRRRRRRRGRRGDRSGGGEQSSRGDQRRDEPRHEGQRREGQRRDGQRRDERRDDQSRREEYPRRDEQRRDDQLRDDQLRDDQPRDDQHREEGRRSEESLPFEDADVELPSADSTARTESKGAETDERRPRRRRRRRRRGARDHSTGPATGARQSEDAAEASAVPPVDHDLDEEETLEDVVDQDDDGDEDDKGDGTSRSHKKIPSWQEAIEVVISANMAQRARNPGGGQRGRGGRRDRDH